MPTTNYVEFKGYLTTTEDPDAGTETTEPVEDEAPVDTGLLEVLPMDETDAQETKKPEDEVLTPTAKAIAVAKTCTLAGRPDLIAGFLERKTSLASVRTKLLAAQAKAKAPYRPATGQADNPLIAAAKQQATKQAHKDQYRAY